MLSPADHARIKAAHEAVVDTLGVPAIWTSHTDPMNTKDAVVGFKSVSWRDEELANAFGIGAKIFTIKVSDIPVVVKFDNVTIHDEIYTIDSVMPTYLNGDKIFHKAVVRGK